MTVPWILTAALAGLWLLVTLLQLGDLATVFLDSRTARDRDIPGRIARERTNEVFWVIPVGVLLALGVGVGVDRAGHYFFGAADPDLGTLLVLGLAVVIVGIGILALAAVAATDPISYSALRRELREYEGERITPTQLADFRARLTAIDNRARSRTHTGRPSGNGQRPSRFSRTTPGVLRLVTIVVGLLLIAAVWIAVSLDPNGMSQIIHVSHVHHASPASQSVALVLFTIPAPILNALFAILGIRLSVASDAAWRRVYARQRLDILRLLEKFERSTRKGIAGLGDRVARALKILGEQQP
jgi:hypothetical protein